MELSTGAGHHRGGPSAANTGSHQGNGGIICETGLVWPAYENLIYNRKVLKWMLY